MSAWRDVFFGDGPVARLLFAAGVLLAGYAILHQYPCHCDVGVTIDFLTRTATGERLYRDIYEWSPPLFFLLASPPILLAKAMGVSPLTAFDAWIMLLLASSIWLSAQVIVRTNRFPHAWQRGAFSWALLFVLGPLLGENFGQKEHMAVLLALPALLMTGAMAEGVVLPRRWRIAIGVAGGLGLAIKPYFVPVWIVLEVYAQLRARPPLVRGENVAVAAVMGAYVLVVVFFVPEYFRNVRLAVGAYGGYDTPLWFVLSRSPWMLMGVATALLVTAWVRRARASVATPLWLGMLCFAGGAVAQRKGWLYHWVPAFVLAFLVIVVLALIWAGRPRFLRSDQWLVPVVLAALMFVAVGEDLAPGTPTDRKMRGVIADLSTVVHDHAAGQTVAWLSTDLWPEFPVLTYGGARSALHFDYLWILPQIYGESKDGTRDVHVNPPDKRPPNEALLVESVIHDLETRKPALIVVDHRSVKQGFSTHFDIERYFNAEERFRTVMASYHLLSEQHGFRFYARATEGEGTRGSRN